MRRDGLSLTAASRKAKTTPRTVRRYANVNMVRRSDHWTVAAGDRLVRHMYVNSGGRQIGVNVRGSRKASELSAYHAAVHHYLSTGDESKLRRFTGKSVAGFEYETDPDVLDEMGRRHQLSIESIYQAVA